MLIIAVSDSFCLIHISYYRWPWTSM